MDRPAVAYQFFGGAHQVLGEMGQSMLDVYSSATSIAAAQITAAEMFGHDTAMAPWGCLTVEAEAFGCTLEFHDFYYPQVRTRPIADSTNLGRLTNVDRSELPGRMPLMLDALTALRAGCGDDLYVIGMVVSPFLVCCELRDMSTFLLDLQLRPEFATELLTQVTAGLCAYVEAMVGTGACDAVMFENAAMTAELLGPHHVSEFIRPHHRRLLAAARAANPDVLLIEHNCGAAPYFAEIHESDVDAISFAVQRLQHALPETVAGRLAGVGMLDHAELLLKGTPAEVFEAAQACINTSAGRRFVLSTGCEIPFKAPIANIQAISKAARSTSQP